MADLRTTLENAARTGAATLLDIPDAIDRLVDFPDDGFGILGQLDDFTDGVRAGFRDLLTPDPDGNPYTPGLPTPNLPGPPMGNCPVTYTGTVRFNSDRFGNPDQRTGFVNGPGAIARVVGNTVGQNQQLQLTNDAGNIITLISFTPQTQGELMEIVSAEFVPRDGSPDSCPGATPPPPPFIDDPVTYDPPTGPPITITPIITFNPITVNFNNTTIIPIGIMYNDVDIKANLNLNLGGVEFNFGGGGGGSDCCLPPQLPELPPSEPDPEPDPDNVSKISGVIVTVTSISPDANFTAFQMPQGPTIYFPDLGLISFRVRIDGVLSWTAPIRIQNRRQIIPVPWADGAVDVAGLSRPGVNFTITTVFDDFAQPPPN